MAEKRSETGAASGVRLSRYLTEIDESQQTHLLTAFCDQRRRRVLRVLLDGPASVERLARRVADAETEGAGTADEDRIGDVVLSLYHVHLPKLDAAGFVSFDPDREYVAPGWSLAAVAPCLVSR